MHGFNHTKISSLSQNNGLKQQTKKQKNKKKKKKMQDWGKGIITLNSMSL